jgi:hypothetical protein
MASQGVLLCGGSVLAPKDSRSIVMRTVLGKVEVVSPRLWACSCAGKQGEPPIFPVGVPPYFQVVECHNHVLE